MSPRTPDLVVARQADIVIAAVGKAKLITGDMIKPGAVVMTLELLNAMAAFVAMLISDQLKVAGAISPVPGGVDHNYAVV